jgi:hypothetical protein
MIPTVGAARPGGVDGRLLTLLTDDAFRTSLTNLARESKTNDLLESGNTAVWHTRQQWRDSRREFGSGE